MPIAFLRGGDNPPNDRSLTVYWDCFLIYLSFFIHQRFFSPVLCLTATLKICKYEMLWLVQKLIVISVTSFTGLYVYFVIFLRIIVKRLL